MAQYESSVDKFKIQFDISEDGEPDYQDYIVVTMSYDQGETLDTWQDLYNKFSNNVKTGLDPTWSLSAKLDKSSPVCQFVLSKEHAVGAEATAKTRIIHHRTGCCLTRLKPNLSRTHAIKIIQVIRFRAA